MNDLFSHRDHLLSILEKKQVVVCTGLEGVGKTTIAAALAVRTARAGKRVVCVTIDPTQRLADLLGIPWDAADGRIQSATELLGPNGSSEGQLSFCLLDPQKTLASVIRARAASPTAARRILRNKLYRYLSVSLTGVQELMILEQLHRLKGNDDFDLIVLDTPPTANAAGFFTAPRRITKVLNGRLVHMMRRANTNRGRSRLFGPWSSSLLNMLARFTGPDLLDEIMQFVDALSDLVTGFAERARAAEKLLHGDDASLCLVAVPTPSAVDEITEYRKQLSHLKLEADAVIFNRTHLPKADPPPRALLGRKAASEAKQLRDIWNAAHDAEQEIIAQVQKNWPGLAAAITVPILPEGVMRVASLDAIGRVL